MWFGDKGSHYVVQAGLNLEIPLTHGREQGQETDLTESYLVMEAAESKL